MSTNFFTNNGQNTLLEKFKGIFENHKDIEFFDSLVGYFRASGYFAIRPYLQYVPKIRILVGINVDKLIAKYHARGLLFQGDATQTIQEYLKEVQTDIQSANYNSDVEKGILHRFSSMHCFCSSFDRHVLPDTDLLRNPQGKLASFSCNKP